MKVLSLYESLYLGVAVDSSDENWVSGNVILGMKLFYEFGINKCLNDFQATL